MNSAARVGALIIVFAALTVGSLTVLGKGMFGAKTETYYISLPDAGGLVSGTKVLMAGVQVGTVNQIQLINPTEAKISLLVKKEISIPIGATALIPTSLTGFGESQVMLIPGAVTGSSLEPGATIPGKKGGAMDSILPNSQETLAELSKTMTAFRKIMEDKEFFGSIKTLLKTTNSTMVNFSKTASSVNSLIVANRASIDSSMRRVAMMMDNVQSMTGDLAAMLKDGKIQRNTTAIMENLVATTTKVNKLMADMNDIVGDPEFKKAIKGSTANIAKITDSGTRMADSGEKIAANFEVMTKDGKEISKRTIDLMDKLNEIARKATEIEDQLKGTITKVSGAVDTVSGALTKGGSNPLSGTTARMDLLRESKPNYYRTDFTLKIPQKDGAYTLGVYDAFYSNKLTLQKGVDLSDKLGIRYGIFASRPAFGVDYQIGSKTSWRGDFWDINDPRFDFRFSHEFSKGIVGWFGMDRVFRDNAPVIGIGINK